MTAWHARVSVSALIKRVMPSVPTVEGMKTMHTSTFEAYMMFRMSEAEHIAKSYLYVDPPKSWVFNTDNPEYEYFTLDAYDRSLVPNSMNWGEW